MPKERTTISLDGDLIKGAKSRGINISGVTEMALKKKCTGSIMDAVEERVCAKCQDKSKKKLIWLCPDEVWCCKGCLKNEVKIIKIGLNARK